MIHFRSPWLAHLPQIKVDNRLARQSVRLILAGIGGLLLLLLLLLIWQPTARSGPVYLLYWLHDRLFLPFKAYTYTIFFPSSLIWWGIAATIFVLWLISFLTDRSLILQPHLWLLRFAIHQPGFHPVLVGSAQYFKRRTIQPALLMTVTEQERALACNHVGMQLAANADPNAVRAVVRFTKLLVQLHLLPTSTPADQLFAAAIWVETLSLLPVLDLTVEDEAKNLKTELLAELASCAKLIESGLSSRINPATAPEHAPPSPFASESFAADCYLIGCSQPQLAHHRFGADVAVGLDQYKISSHLARTVTKRRVLLDQLRQQVESNRGQNSLPLVAASAGLGFSHAARPAAHELALMGRLSFSIALYTAALAAAPEIALSYLDTVETLAFALAFAPDMRSTEQTVYQELTAVVANLPTVLDYQLCAALQAKHLHTRRQAWADSPLDHAELILATDFDLAETQVAALLHAAGPPPAAEKYVTHERAWVGNAVAQLQRLGPAYALWQKHAPVYTARARERLGAYTHALREQADALYQQYGGNEELTNRVGTVRTQANHWRQRSVEQIRWLFAHTITSGKASTFLVEQWHQCRTSIDALRKRWRDKK